MHHKMGSKWIWMKSVEFELWRSHEILSRLFVCDRFKSLMNQNWCQRCSFTKMCHHPEWISSHSAIYIRVCHIFLDFKVSRYIEGYSFMSIWEPQVKNLRRLGRKLKLSWLCPVRYRVRTTSILVRAFWNFKLKVLKYSRNCSLQYTLIPNFWHPLIYILDWGIVKYINMKFFYELKKRTC